MSNRRVFARFFLHFVRSRGANVRFRCDIVRYRPQSCESERNMKRNHPSPAQALPISLEVYQQLCRAVCLSKFEKEDWEIGEIAIRDWMARHDPDSFAMPVASGFQWKQLFLPDGTLLRTVFDGRNHHCRVDGDRLLHDGVATTPSRFANAVGGIHRNAWKVIWVLFPNCTTWKPASMLRAKRRAPEKRPAKSKGAAVPTLATKCKPVCVPLPEAAGLPRGDADRRSAARPLGN